MKKQYYFLLTLLACVLAGLSACSNDNEVEYTPKEKLILQNYDLLFTCNASEGSVTIANESSVTATSEQSWCTVTTSGNKVIVNVTANNSFEGRSCKITIHGNGKEAQVIAQQAGLIFSVNKGGAYVTNAAAKEHLLPIDYTGNSPLRVDPASVDWATFSVVDGVLHADLALNVGEEPRETEAVLWAGDVKLTVPIRQQGLSFIVNGGKSIVSNDDATGRNYTIETSEGIEYSVAPSSVDWARFSIVNGELHIDFDENNTGKMRQTEAVITYAGSLTYKINVQQFDFDKDVLGTYTLSWGSKTTKLSFERNEEGKAQWRFIEGNYASMGVVIPVTLDEEDFSLMIPNLLDLTATYTKNDVVYKLTVFVMSQKGSSVYRHNNNKLAAIGKLTIDDDGGCNWQFSLNDQLDSSTYKFYGIRLAYGNGGYGGYVGSYVTFNGMKLTRD